MPSVARPLPSKGAGCWRQYCSGDQMASRPDGRDTKLACVQVGRCSSVCSLERFVGVPAFLLDCSSVRGSAARFSCFSDLGGPFSKLSRGAFFLSSLRKPLSLACGYALTEHIGYAPVVSICFQLFVLPSAAEGKRLMASRPETLGSFKLRFFQRCKPAASEVT